jgi:hypothetical protein
MLEFFGAKFSVRNSYPENLSIPKISKNPKKVMNMVETLKWVLQEKMINTRPLVRRTIM